MPSPETSEDLAEASDDGSRSGSEDTLSTEYEDKEVLELEKPEAETEPNCSYLGVNTKDEHDTVDEDSQHD
jgi:hypothetical protein